MRRCIVRQKEVLKLPDKEIAANLCVNLSTVQRVTALFRIKGKLVRSLIHLRVLSGNYLVCYLLLSLPARHVCK